MLMEFLTPGDLLLPEFIYGIWGTYIDKTGLKKDVDKEIERFDLIDYRGKNQSCFLFLIAVTLVERTKLYVLDPQNVGWIVKPISISL